MPLCKYKNYCNFLEPYFTILTEKEEFYKNNTISFQCNEKSHINILNIHSFGNKKYKIKAINFCQGCKDEKDIIIQTENFTKKVFDKTGHIIINVNFSTRKVEYKCRNCGYISNSFTQNFEDATSFCGKCQNDKYKIPFEKLKDKVETHGFTLLTKECEYKNNKKKLSILCVCGRPYESVLSDIVRDKNCSECKLKKYEETCMERYGVRNVSQDPIIFEKIVKKSYTGKKHKLPSGKVVHIQGYEGQAIDDLLEEKIEENDIYFGKDIPTFSYVQDNIQHVYHPDLFIKSQNLIVEVKSDYTYKRELDKNFLKFKKVIQEGYSLRVMIYNDKLNLIKDMTLDKIEDLPENILADIEAFSELSRICL